MDRNYFLAQQFPGCKLDPISKAWEMLPPYVRSLRIIKNELWTDVIDQPLIPFEEILKLLDQ